MTVPHLEAQNNDELTDLLRKLRAAEESMLNTEKELEQKKLNENKLNRVLVLCTTIVAAISMGATAYILLYQREAIRQFPEQKLLLGVVAIIGGFASSLGLLAGRDTKVRDNIKSINNDILDVKINQLKENIQDDFFTTLVNINFKYIDKYYEQTQDQANKSFRVARTAGIFGFCIICVGILLMYFTGKAPAYVTTGAGVVCEAIATIFYYLYNRTVLKMSEYHQKLVITQNISLALKMSESLTGESRNVALSQIIDRLTIDVNRYLSEK